MYFCWEKNFEERETNLNTLFFFFEMFGKRKVSESELKLINYVHHKCKHTHEWQLIDRFFLFAKPKRDKNSKFQIFFIDYHTSIIKQQQQKKWEQN